MTRSIRGAAAMLALAAAAAPLSAQTNSFAPGAQVNSPTLTGFTTNGSQMVGMALTLELAGGGGTIATSWIDDGAGFCGGSFANGFSIAFDCGGNTFTGAWTITNGGQDRIASLRINGAPGRTLFDCGFNAGGDCSNVGDGGSTGTTGSELGWSMETVGGTYGGSVSGFYTNAVGLGGNAPIGDLFEQLTIRFDNVLSGDQTYSFRADTDNSSFDAPPPTIVPEPSTYALMFSGLMGIGFMARRRRNNV